MNILSSHLLRVATLALALPIVGMCAAIQINGVCIQGNCFVPNTVTFGNSESGSTNTNVTLNTDKFNVATSFTASYSNNGTFISFFPTATYVGPNFSVATDTITIDLLASFFDNTPGNWDGPYNEHVTLLVKALGTASGQLFVDGQGLPLVGPFGPGSWDESHTKTLVGLNGDTLNYDYQFVFKFNPGNKTGNFIGSPTPEPAQMIPAALSLVGFGLVALRRRKKSVV